MVLKKIIIKEFFFYIRYIYRALQYCKPMNRLKQVVIVLLHLGCKIQKFFKCGDIVWEPWVTKEDKKTFMRVIETKLDGEAYEV